jgi:hypothetical protein
MDRTRTAADFMRDSVRTVAEEKRRESLRRFKAKARFRARIVEAQALADGRPLSDASSKPRSKLS